MAAVLVQLVPLILGAVLAPLWVIIVLLLLASPRGLQKATAFVLGMTLTRLAQGLIFGVVFTAAPDADDGTSPIVSTLLMLVGILLLITAVRKWRKEEDPDDPPPKWMSSIEQTSPLKALGLGALLVAIGPKLWVFTLSVLSIISASDLGLAGGVAVYLVYIVLAQILLFLAILIVVVAPEASTALLQRALGWLKTYNRPISITVALIFGAYFTWNGVMGLLS
jgi:hypothetical protein